MERGSVEVLLVEDEAAHADLVRRAFADCDLHMGDVDLVVVRTLKAARAYLDKSVPALVITDLRLPDGAGSDLLPGAGEERPYPVVIMTSQGDEQVAVEAMKAGALDYVVKSNVTLATMPRLAERALREGRHIAERKRAEHDLERFRAMLDLASDAVFLICPQTGRFLDFNETAMRRLGYTRQELLQLRIQDVEVGDHPIEDEAQWQAQVKGIKSGRLSFLAEGIHQGEDGHRFPVEVTVAVQNFAGQEYLLAVARDITKRKETEEALQQSEKKYARVFHSNPHSITISSLRTGRFIEVNDHFLAVTGLQREDVIGRTGAELGLWVDPAQRVDLFEMVQRQGTVENLEVELFVKPGEKITCLISAEQIDLDGEPGMITVTRNITDRRRAEQEVERLKNFYEQLLNGMPAQLAVYDLDGRYVYLTPSAVQNPEMCKWLLGKTDEEYCLKRGLDPAIGRRRNEAIRQVLHEKILVQFEESFPARSGNLRHFVRILSPILDLEGALVQILSYGLDISDRKLTEDALREKEERFRELFNSSPDAIFVEDLDGYVLDVNEAACRLHRTERGDLIGQHVEALVPLDQRASVMEQSNRLVRGEIESIEAYSWTRDERSVPVEVRANAITYAGKPAVLLHARDITRRKQTEEILRNSEERLKVLFEFAPDAYYLNDLHGVFIDGNKAAEELVGYDRDELIGKSFVTVGLLPLNQIPKALAALSRNVLGMTTGPEEYVLVRKDGQRIPVEISTYPVKIQGQTLVLGIARDISEHKRLEEQIRRHNEELEHLVKLRTDRVQELERQRAEIQKLVATGRMAAGIAHEINNPLASITNSFELVAAAIPETHPRYEFVRRIEQDLDRVATIIRHMYNLYKPTQEAAQTLSVETILEEIHTLFESHCRQQEVRILITAAAAQDRVHLPQTYVHQVLFNVIHNAIDASPPGATVEVVAETDRYVVTFTIIDHGEGIPADIQKQIFEPFFSSKQNGRMGLGLAISRSLVGAMGGGITLKSTPGAGSIFHITLPRELETDVETHQATAWAK